MVPALIETKMQPEYLDHNRLLSFRTGAVGGFMQVP